MPTAKRQKSIREAMTDAGRAADTKLDSISKSVKKSEKDIADIKKTLKDMQRALAKLAGPEKKSGAAKKTTAAKKAAPGKRPSAKKKQRKPAKRRKRKSTPSIFPY